VNNANLQQPEVKLVHDYITQRGGAERVALVLARAFEGAEFLTTLHNPSATFSEFDHINVKTSWLNSFGLFRRNHRLALPLLPFAVRSLKSDAKLTIVSTSAFAHGVKASGQTLVYCHTPPRFLYLSDEYLGAGLSARVLGAALRLLKPAFRRADQMAAKRATRYLANSTVVQARIRDVYGIEAKVVFPPHSVEIDGDLKPLFTAQEKFAQTPFFLLVSRLLPYKNVDQVIEAFRRLPNKNLLIVGSGPLLQELQKKLPSNCLIVSGITDDELRWAYAQATALLAPSLEDFGLTVIEAAARGVPSIALRAGGYLDTVVEGETGIFFSQPTAESIERAVFEFELSNFDALKISKHAEAFSEERFIAAIRAEATEMLKNDSTKQAHN